MPPMHILLRGDTLQRLRIASGLILFLFAATHFLNHALGLIHVDAMHAMQRWRWVVTRSVPGTFLLVTALVTHIGLALYKVAARATLRLPAWELTQLGLGLLIPFLLFPHIVNTRVARVSFGVEDTYLYELARLWPDGALLQTTLLLVVWVHGCMGLHYWLRLTPRLSRRRAGSAVPRHRRAACLARRVHGVGPVGGSADREPGGPGARQAAHQLAECGAERDARRLPQYGPLGLRRRAHGCLRRGRLAMADAERGTARRYSLHRRPHHQRAARADLARDQPLAWHSARLGVRRTCALLHLPRARGGGFRRACPRRPFRKSSRSTASPHRRTCASPARSGRSKLSR